MNKMLLQKTHKTRFPHLTGAASLDEWREAKRIVDGDLDGDRARGKMFDAFGCHGEPIADAIEQALSKMVDLFPEHTRGRAAADAILIDAYSDIGATMAEVRSELDRLLERYVEGKRQEAVEAVCYAVPEGSDLQAHDYGVTLDTSLEEAFECGVDAIGSYVRETLESNSIDYESHTLDDL